jgi:hypothetical protein
MKFMILLLIGEGFQEQATQAERGASSSRPSR